MKKNNSSQESNNSNKSNIDSYDVLFTRDGAKKETNQKWKEGLLVYNKDNGQVRYPSVIYVLIFKI